MQRQDLLIGTRIDQNTSKSYDPSCLYRHLKKYLMLLGYTGIHLSVLPVPTKNSIMTILIQK